MVSLQKPVDIADMRAAFPAMPMPIRDKVTLKGLVRVLSHIVDCAASHRTPERPIGLIHLAIPNTLWHNYSGGTYPTRAANPGAVPFYGPNANGQRRADVNNAFAVHYKAYHDEQAMDGALSERFELMLPAKAAQELRVMKLTMANPTFLQIFTRAVQKWGRTTPTQRMQNRNDMTADWNAADGMSSLWYRLKECMNFGEYCGEEIPENEVRDAALICINRSGAYRQAYLDWKREPNQTYENLRNFFDTAEADLEDVMDEAQQHGYGGAATDALDDDAATQAFKESLTNLASAVNANQSANMANTQAMQHAEQLNALMQQMSQMQQQMAMLTQQQQPRQQWTPPPPTQPPQQQWTPPPAPPCPPAPAYQPAQQSAGQSTRGGPTASNPKNPFRVFENRNYCWSHGFHVEDDHTSATCMRPKPGHDFTATAPNNDQACTLGAHKTIMPSVSGRPANHRSQANAPWMRRSGGAGRGRGRQQQQQTNTNWNAQNYATNNQQQRWQGTQNRPQYTQYGNNFGAQQSTQQGPPPGFQQQWNNNTWGNKGNNF